MLILFALIVMRMSGAVAFNPILGRTNLPPRVKAAFILGLSVLLYISFPHELQHAPSGMLEFGVMLAKELLLGFVIGFSMELCTFTVRFASAIMDFVMGLSMAQIYDPQYNAQMTITSGMYFVFMALLFFAIDGHIRLLQIFYDSARLIPFGMVSLRPELSQLMLAVFEDCILLGFQLAVPIIAMEMVTETAVGILMRIIPQINVFVVNFQAKIVVGMLMLLFLFSPMSDKLYRILDYTFKTMEDFVWLMR